MTMYWESPHKFEPKVFQGREQLACDICGYMDSAAVHQTGGSVEQEKPRQPWDSAFEPHDPMESASEYLTRVRIGSKTYSDGTVATGVLPLPDRSPLETP